jgi:hypothetical protein
MQARTGSHNRSIVGRALLAGAMLVVGTVAGTSSTSASSTHQAAGMTPHDARHRVPAGGPRVVHGAIADVLVRVQGGQLCSGTPITGTVYVVTAAHCVLDQDGGSPPRTVVRDGVTYSATAVLVDDRYLDEPRAQLDAAVLVMDQVVPGASATIGSGVPTSGAVTIAGYQSLDSDGTLLRGEDPYDVAVPKGATGTLIEIASAPAGCTVPVGSLSVLGGRVDVPCGLIPGASGGGMFADVNGTIVLIGIVSTVTFDLSVNGIVPLESLLQLLRHPERYRHQVTATRGTGDSTRIIRS